MVFWSASVLEAKNCVYLTCATIDDGGRAVVTTYLQDGLANALLCDEKLQLSTCPAQVKGVLDGNMRHNIRDHLIWQRD
jgi:hypothetical protein